MYSEVCRLINCIGMLHKEFSEEFFSTHKSINLKSTTIKNVIGEQSYNEDFINLLDDYIEGLASFLIFNTFKTDSPEIETRFRGKLRESTLNKISYHRFGKYKGEMPINKVLNDLLGFRIILDVDDSYREILEKITNNKEIRVKLFRPYPRVDEGYQAVHIYFKSDNNKYFPWELQVWKKVDAESNELSHRLHKEKRKYIHWTEIYEKNKQREER